jgi:hypothetical protein
LGINIYSLSEKKTRPLGKSIRTIAKDLCVDILYELNFTQAVKHGAVNSLFPCHIVF